MVPLPVCQRQLLLSIEIIKLNILQNPIPTNKPNTEAKRPPRPVNITPNCKLSPIATNHISVTWCADFNKHFFVSVYLVKKLSSAQLLSGMRTAQRILSSDATRALSEFFMKIFYHREKIRNKTRNVIRDGLRIVIDSMEKS